MGANLQDPHGAINSADPKNRDIVPFSLGLFQMSQVRFFSMTKLAQGYLSSILCR